MRRLVRKADAALNLNQALYEADSIASGDYVVKAEVLEEILDGMDWDGNSELTPSTKSNDWYSPDDPGEVSLEAQGSIDVNKLTAKFGTISADDIANIKHELEENEDVVKDHVKEVLDGFKDMQMNNFSFEYKITVNGTVIKISAEADEIEIHE